MSNGDPYDLLIRKPNQQYEKFKNRYNNNNPFTSNNPQGDQNVDNERDLREEAESVLYRPFRTWRVPNRRAIMVKERDPEDEGWIVTEYYEEDFASPVFSWTFDDADLDLDTVWPLDECEEIELEQ